MHNHKECIWKIYLNRQDNEEYNGENPLHMLFLYSKK
jgi:hypothetical protein